MLFVKMSAGVCVFDFAELLYCHENVMNDQYIDFPTGSQQLEILS